MPVRQQRAAAGALSLSLSRGRTAGFLLRVRTLRLDVRASTPTSGVGADLAVSAWWSFPEGAATCGIVVIRLSLKKGRITFPGWRSQEKGRPDVWSPRDSCRSWHGTRTTLQEQPGARGGIAAEARATDSIQMRRASFAAVCSKDDRQALIRVRPRVIHRQILAATRQQLRCFAYALRRANADDGARPHGSDQAVAEWALGPCAGSSPAARRRPETFVVEAGRLHMRGRLPAAGPARQVRRAAAPSGNAACARITGPRDSLERLCGLGADVPNDTAKQSQAWAAGRLDFSASRAVLKWPVGCCPSVSVGGG